MRQLATDDGAARTTPYGHQGRDPGEWLRAGRARHHRSRSVRSLLADRLFHAGARTVRVRPRPRPAALSSAAAGCHAAGRTAGRRLRPPPSRREDHVRRRRVLRFRQVDAEARRQGEARRPRRQARRDQPRSHHRGRTHRQHRLGRVQPEAVGPSCRVGQGLPRVSKGVEANRIYTEGKGKSQPIAPNTINGKDNPAGRAKNRRVEIEVVGTRAPNR